MVAEDSWRDILRDRNFAIKAYEDILRALETELENPLDFSPKALSRSMEQWSSWLEAFKKADDRLRSVSRVFASRTKDTGSISIEPSILHDSFKRIEAIKERSFAMKRLITGRMAALGREISSRPARRPFSKPFRENQPSLLDLRA